MNRIFITLLLCGALSLPAFPQQTSSSSTAQPAASADKTAPAAHGETATGQEPLRETKGDFWDGDEPGAAALFLHPFASKAYVQRHTAPIRDRVNELEELTAANGGQIRDVDTRTQQGIQLVSKKTDEANEHALDASNKAQMAQQAANAVNTHLTRVETVVGKVDQYNTGAQTEIRFRPGQTVLTKDAKQALDETAAALKDQHGYIVEVQGFASGHGQAAIAASRKMADSVVRYLVLNHQIPAYRIFVVGMGNAPVTRKDATTAKDTGSSRVEVSVLKNGLDQLASTPAPDAGTPPK